MTDNYDYNRFGKKGKRVGQAVSDILNTSNQIQLTVEDVLEAYKDKFTSELKATIEANVEKLGQLFYVLVLSKKEMWAENMVRNWFIARNTKPSAKYMMSEYANYMKTLYKVSDHGTNVEIIWSIPGYEECKSVLKNPGLFDPQLVSWITNGETGKLDN